MNLPNFFVLGNPRSGTSLFRSMLNAHPGIVVPPECGFILWLAPDWVHQDWSSSTTLRSFAEAVSATRKFETWNLGGEDLFRSLASRHVADYQSAVERIILAYAAKRGRSALTWGDKNNYYVTQVRELLALFPDARYLHIVRDPRDVACSYRELADRSITSAYRPELEHDVSAIAAEWVRNNQQVIDRLQGHAGYMRIRYEDLVHNVPLEMERVFDHLGVASLDPATADMHLLTLDEPPEFLQWKTKLTRPADTSSVGRFRTDLPLQDQLALENFAGELMAFFGYK